MAFTLSSSALLVGLACFALAQREPTVIMKDDKNLRRLEPQNSAVSTGKQRTDQGPERPEIYDFFQVLSVSFYVRLSISHSNNTVSHVANIKKKLLSVVVFFFLN